MNRKPNAGPYVVSWVDWHGNPKREERHTWADACALMREKLIEGCDAVSVAFC